MSTIGVSFCCDGSQLTHGFGFEVISTVEGTVGHPQICLLCALPSAANELHMCMYMYMHVSGNVLGWEDLGSKEG